VNSIQKHPIGLFDSGVGGISIWKKINQLLPNEHTIYLADSKNAPYGEKPFKEIIELSKKNTEFLLRKKAKIIIVACNTATTNTISLLRDSYKIPFIGIEPAIKSAELITKTKKIGLLATKATMRSKLLGKTAASLDKSIEIIEQIGTGLVDLIEKGKIDSPETHQLLCKYLKPMIKQHIDALVLGCSHYAHLTDQIKRIVGDSLRIIDSSPAVAKQTRRVLENLNLLNSNVSSEPASHQFYSNKNKEVLTQLVNNPAVKIKKTRF